MRRLYWNDAQGTLFIGADQGLHLSTDRGGTFTGVCGPLRNSILGGIAVSGSTILTGVHDVDPILSSGAGGFKSGGAETGSP